MESVKAYQLCKLVVGLEPAQHAAELVVVAVLSQACLLLQYVSGACYKLSKEPGTLHLRCK